MKKRLMDLIWCPDCQADLKLEVSEERDGEIITGQVSCPSCRKDYPILKGIPRFIEGLRTEADLRKVYADSFGHQWTTYNWLREEDEFEFYQITDLKKEDLKGKTIFDGGCGGGRFLRIVAPECKEIVGLDFSIAVDKAYQLCAKYPHAHFIQCDINRHPMRPANFDIVYSHGVIHHTPDTKRAFDRLPELVKEGGLFYLAVFRKAVAPLRWSDTAWRTALNKLPIPMLDKVCGGMSYLSFLPAAVFWKRFFWFSLQKTHEIRKCCLYDWYAPTYHHEHSVEEVVGWFQEAGFNDVKYINAWPYCPPELKYSIPKVWNNIRLGLLLGVIGRKGHGAQAKKGQSSSLAPESEPASKPSFLSR